MAEGGCLLEDKPVKQYTYLMNKVIALASGLVFFSLPLALYSQSKPATLVKPTYNTDLSFQNNTSVNVGVGNIPSSILVSENLEQDTNEESIPNATNSDIVITTELGETQLRLATGTSTEEESEVKRLSEVVERINQDYEVAEKECKNGSWFERVWCSMTSWL